MRRAILLPFLVAAAGCASPPVRAETAELRPVPRSDAIAGAGGAAAAVLPADDAGAVASLVADARTRGGATLADCMRLAEMTQEDLLSGEEDRLQAALKRDLAVAGVLPALSLSAFAFVQDRVPSAGGGGGGSFSPSADREQWAMTVRQPIFRGFAESAAIRASDRTAESKAASIDAMRSALRRSVARAFFGVLEAEAEVRTLADSERLDRTRIGEMRARQENGIARRTEVLLLESQLEVTLATLQRAKTRRDVTRTTLDQLTGADLDAPLVDTEPEPAPVPDRPAALAEALGSRPELRAAGLAAEAAEASVAVARAGYWPSLGFAGNWYLGRAGVSQFTRSTDWDAQVNFDFPLFEGGATRSRERTAKSEVRRARLLESATLRGIVQDVESLLARVAAGGALLATFERNAQLAKENVALLREEYLHGIATNLEVLTAQNVLREAQLDVERQRLVNRLDRVELSLALGRTEIDR